ncbi:MAG: response regulator [Chloroflexi bacterium]|nr:MAG: response regulator [Chloroflexota bacterium]
MAKPNILVVDSDEGFGLMLKEGLETNGYYQAQWVASGGDALQTLVESTFDLVIVEPDLPDMAAEQFIRAVREVNGDMKIMAVSLMGMPLPPGLEALGLNGILPKPFFVGDLPDLVDEALGRKRRPSQVVTVRPPSTPVPVEEPTPAEQPETGAPAEETEIDFEGLPPLPAPAVSYDTIRYLRANEPEILRLLNDLNREVRAEVILLVAGTELIAQAGMLSREQSLQLAQLMIQIAQASAQAARFLGEPNGQFVQSLHEGDAYRLYSLSLSEGVLLSLALSSNVPLGMIRHQCRQIAGKLAKYII